MRVSKTCFVYPHGSQYRSEVDKKGQKKMGMFIVVIFILLILGLIRRRNLRRAAIRASIRRIPR